LLVESLASPLHNLWIEVQWLANVSISSHNFRYVSSPSHIYRCRPCKHSACHSFESEHQSRPLEFTSHVHSDTFAIDNMFGNYSITSATQHSSSLQYDDDSSYCTSRPVSPCDTRTTSHASAPPLSISQLAQQFDAQDINSTRGDRQQEPCTSYFHAVAAPSEQVNDPYSSQHIGRPAYMRAPSSHSRRLQRQRDVRRQCDPDQLRNISDLVARMVESGNQCGVTSQPERTTISQGSTSDDEEYISSSSSRSSPTITSPSSGDERRSSWISTSDYYFVQRRSSEAIAITSAGGLSKVSSRVEKSRHRRSSGRHARVL